MDPELNELIIEEKKLKIDEHKADILDRQWRSCCFDLHAESSVFFAKLSISIMTMALCSYQLINNSDCSMQSLYSSILSSTITFWLNKK